MAMITTIQQHILQQQQQLLGSGREATGTFSWLLSGITLAAKMIEARIRTAGLSSEVYGAAGAENVQGEQQQKLDVYANQALLHCLGLRDSVAALVSEEDEEPVRFNRDPRNRQVHHRLRPPRRIVQHRRQRQRRHHLQRSPASPDRARLP